MVVTVSSCHVFEEAPWAEIITSDLQLFDSCSLLLLARGQTVLSFLPASGLGEEGGHLAQVYCCSHARPVEEPVSTRSHEHCCEPPATLHCVNTQEGTDSLSLYDCCSFP